MNTDIVNLTTITTSLTNGYITISTASTDKNDLKTILSYAIPLSCLMIILALVAFIGIRQRRRVLEKWTSLKRMKNTNPRFLQSVGLRGDSEFDSYNHDNVSSSTIISQENPLQSEQQYHLATIT